MNSPLPHSPEGLHQPHTPATLSSDDIALPAEGSIAIDIGTPVRARPFDFRGDSNSSFRWAAAGLVGLILFCVALQLAGPLAMLGRHISLNNNEGWNAYWTTRALAGQPIYTDAASPLTNNYPPLSFYIVGWLGRAIGDLVLAGRLFSFVGLFGATAMVGLIARRIGKDKRWAWSGAALFLLVAVSMAPRYLAADDPQWLAEATQLLALWMVIPSKTGTPKRARLIGACLVLLATGLIKHNQLALPIAITLALAIHDRRGLAVWMATAIIGLALALGTLHVIYGPAFIDQVLHHQRTLNLRYFFSAMVSLSYLVPASIIIAIYLPRLRGWRHDFRLTTLSLFAALAIILGILQRFGAGVSQNAHFDAIIGVAILLGVVLSSLSSRELSTATRLALMTLAIAPAAGKDLVNIPNRVDDWRELARTDEEWSDAIRFLAAQPGPIACERPALCYWAGKPYQLDFFNYGQKLRLGHDPWDLRDRLARREFSAIVVIRDRAAKGRDPRLPTDYYDLINANYRVERVLPDDIYVMVPAA